VFGCQSKHAPGRRGGTPNGIDEDVQAAEPVEGSLDDPVYPVRSADIRLNKMVGGAASRNRSGSREDPRDSRGFYKVLILRPH
jgi:hypothetical protein